MGLTLEEARELRNSMLQEQKKQRKGQVDAIVANSLSIETVEQRLREMITRYPEKSLFAVEVLNVVTNDLDEYDQKKIRAEVQDELKTKYWDAFLMADLAESNVNDNVIAFRLMMRL